MAPPKSGIKPCTACRYPTRTARASIAEAPGTRTRIRGLCRPCAEVEKPPVMKPRKSRARQPREHRPDADADPNMIASLSSFVKARNLRIARTNRTRP